MALMTYDAATVTGTGAFLNGELERLDPELHQPLIDFQWTRDIPVRKDVTLADDFSSFTNSDFASAGGASPTGKAWIGKASNAIQGIALDISKTANPLTPWGMELTWTLPELESAMKLQRPVDRDKFDAMQLKWNMDMDEMVYTGDDQLGVYGLANNAAIGELEAGIMNVVSGAAGNPQWVTKTAEEILRDVNDAITQAWKNAGYAALPNRVLLPPQQFGYLATRPCTIGGVGFDSILTYLKQNNVAAQQGTEITFYPSKWLVGGGAGGERGRTGSVDRMVAYRFDEKHIRMPYTELTAVPAQFRGISQYVYYWGRIGVVEFVRSLCVVYRDNI